MTTNESVQGGVSRRAFMQRAGITALVAAPAVAVFAGSTSPAYACTPAPDLLINEEFVAQYARLVDVIDAWVAEPGDQVVGLTRLHALRVAIDDCGNEPLKLKIPPPPPPSPFEQYVHYLDGFDRVIAEAVAWIDAAESIGVPGVLSLGILHTDLDDWCGTRPLKWPRPRPPYGPPYPC